MNDNTLRRLTLEYKAAQTVLVALMEYDRDSEEYRRAFQDTLNRCRMLRRQIEMLASEGMQDDAPAMNG